MDLFFTYLQFTYEDLLTQTGEHALAVGISLALGTIVALTLGCLVYQREGGAKVAIGITGTILTIPSFALFGLLIPLLGLGWPPTIVALTLYAIFPILRNTVTGLRGVDTAIVDSAQGMGLSRRQRLFRIELPLAAPVIVAGIRVSALILIGIAAIAAGVGGPGLGEGFFSGLARIGSATALYLVLGALLAVMVLALLFDIGFLVLKRVVTSKGIRN